MPDSFTTNAADVASAIERMSARIADPAPALMRARSVLAEQEQQVFSSQGSVLGASWPPAVDPERKIDPQLLVASGALRRSLTGTSAGTVRGTTLEYGTDVEYAHFHQYGTSRMSARPFLGITDTSARRIVEQLAAAIDGTE